MENLINSVQTEFQIESLLKEGRKYLSESKKLTNKKMISLTKRDYELLYFVLEMKFCTYEEAYKKIYRTNVFDGSTNGPTYSIRRLSQLQKEGFLKSTRAFDASKRLFYGTRKSNNLLKKIFPERNVNRECTCIHGQTVVHDYYVLKTRLKLEESFGVTSWISDRSLKLVPGAYSEFDNGNTPDGIYVNPEGCFAFELEVSVKSKARYQAKVRKYVDYIRANQVDPSVFKKVHYVVFSNAAFKTLNAYTAIYGSYFKIEKAEAYGLRNSLFE